MGWIDATALQPGQIAIEQLNDYRAVPADDAVVDDAVVDDAVADDAVADDAVADDAVADDAVADDAVADDAVADDAESDDALAGWLDEDELFIDEAAFDSEPTADTASLPSAQELFEDSADALPLVEDDASEAPVVEADEGGVVFDPDTAPIMPNQDEITDF
jgi:hypothetical protein